MLDASELPSADCAITILHARGRLLAKLIRTDGSIDSYDKAKHFDAIELGIQGLDHLAAVVRSLLPCWDRCVVRGSLVGGSPATGIRRLLHADRETGDQPAFYELPRRWVAIDVDGIPRPPEIPVADIACCARVAISHLPPEFQGRACVAVASGGHGFKPGIRMRLGIGSTVPRPTRCCASGSSPARSISRRCARCNPSTPPPPFWATASSTRCPTASRCCRVRRW